MGILRQLKHGWNAFTSALINNEPQGYQGSVGSYGNRPDRVRLQFGNERSIISAIYTRLSIDASMFDIRHVRTDSDGRYLEDINSSLQNCLTWEANLDQGSRAFFQDVVLTMCDKAAAALVPVDTNLDPNVTGSYDVQTMRVGEIVNWFPKHVRVSLWNEEKGRREELTLPKNMVAIAVNPLSPVMNEPISTLRRLIRKLNQLDLIDEQSASGKLDLIIQLPYVVKSEARRTQAMQRRKDMEDQLSGSKYGIAYTDATEKITQLNRAAENNLLTQIEYLTKELYGQLGLTPEIMNGTANEATMINYYSRTIEPFLEAIVQAMRRTFLTKTAKTQGQSILYFRDPFKLVPISQLADIADKFSRNKIATPNDMRTAIGWRPSKDPAADVLANANMPTPSPQPVPDPSGQLNPAPPIKVAAMIGRLGQKQLPSAP